MKKISSCDFCAKSIDYEGHLLLLSAIHLKIERFPGLDFGEKEFFEKSKALKRLVNKNNIHINLAYAATQFVNIAREIKTGSSPKSL